MINAEESREPAPVAAPQPSEDKRPDGYPLVWMRSRIIGKSGRAKAHQEYAEYEVHVGDATVWRRREPLGWEAAKMAARISAAHEQERIAGWLTAAEDPAERARTHLPPVAP